MIMAGGSGTRLWPMSRGTTPKQLISLFSGKSLLEIAWERLDGVVDKKQRWICAGEQHANLICEKLQLPLSQILGEPTGPQSPVGFPSPSVNFNLLFVHIVNIVFGM